MFKTTRAITAASLFVLLAACGGGGDNPTQTTTNNGSTVNHSGSGGSTPTNPNTGTSNSGGGSAAPDTGPTTPGSGSNSGSIPTAITSWTIVDLTDKRGLPTSPRDLNNAGDVVGTVVVETTTIGSGLATQNKEDGFLYRNGTFINLGNLGGTYTNANAINNNGVIVGVSTTEPGRAVMPNGFVYQNNAIQDFSQLGGTFNFLKDINDAGQIIGVDENGKAMLFTNGENRAIGILPGDNTIYVDALNNRGEVLGTSGVSGNLSSFRTFLYANGAMQDLSKVNGCQASVFQALNDLGQLAGDCDGRLVIKTGDTLKNLGGLAGYDRHVVLAMNNFGQVAGSAKKAEADGTVFFYDGQNFIDLNTVPSIAASGWKLFGVRKMNDRGQMIGLAAFQGSDSLRYVLISPNQ